MARTQTQDKSLRSSREWHNLITRARKKYRELKLYKYGERDESVLFGLIEAIYLYDAGDRTDTLFAKLERLLHGTRNPGA